MKTISATSDYTSLPLSLRVIRLIISILLAVAVVTELSLSTFWQLTLSGLAVYTLITGLFGRDPLFAVLRLSIGPLRDHALTIVAQVECFAIGFVCIVAGVVNHNADSLIMPLLPFVGIYPMLLCAVKHDLLSYLLQFFKSFV